MFHLWMDGKRIVDVLLAILFFSTSLTNEAQLSEKKSVEINVF